MSRLVVTLMQTHIILYYSSVHFLLVQRYLERYCCNGNDCNDRRYVRVSMRVRASVAMLQ